MTGGKEGKQAEWNRRGGSGIKRIMTRCVCYVFVFLLGVIPSISWGQYDVEEKWPVWIRGLVDVRIARGGRASSWTDQGFGVGKSRYGGTGSLVDGKRSTRFALSQLSVELGAALPWDMSARAQLNAETDIDVDRPLLIEAILRKEWGAAVNGWGLQAGVMHNPFSLEHVGPAWTSLYTLTPSALNTWLWEEVHLVGLEGEWWQTTQSGLRFGMLTGAGFGPDQMARLLAPRGWVLSDYQSGINNDLPLPHRAKRDRVSVFDERDHRPAIYTRLSISDTRNRGELSLGYFDNLGDQDTLGVWSTRFGTIGAVLHPLANVDLLAQYMGGSAQSRASKCDILLHAFYVLLSVHYRGHRLTARYDDFRTDDTDGPPSYRESGTAFTVAYLFEFGLSHRVGFEYMFLDSHRAMPVRSDPSDGGWQLSYRFRY
ncbi:MAG: hypothetical protein FJ147_18025 [Deltaproteobacteria bacterium]|nr:hypothetical protein [Deltaproteobacteria bacterium]